MRNVLLLLAGSASLERYRAVTVHSIRSTQRRSPQNGLIIRLPCRPSKLTCGGLFPRLSSPSFLVSPYRYRRASYSTLARLLLACPLNDAVDMEKISTSEHVRPSLLQESQHRIHGHRTRPSSPQPSRWWSHDFADHLTIELFPNMRDIGLHLESRRNDHFSNVVAEEREGGAYSRRTTAETPTASDVEAERRPLGELSSPSFSMSSTDAVKRLLPLLETATQQFSSHSDAATFQAPEGSCTTRTSPSHFSLPRWGVHRGVLEQLFLHVYFFPGVSYLPLRRRLQAQCTAMFQQAGIPVGWLSPSLRYALQSCVVILLHSSAYSMNLAMDYLLRKGEPLLALECFMIWWYANPDQVPIELPFQQRFLPFSTGQSNRGGKEGKKEEEEMKSVTMDCRRPEGCLEAYLKTPPSSSYGGRDARGLGFLCPQAVFPTAYREGLRRHLRDTGTVVSAKNHITSSLLLRVFEVAFSLHWKKEEEERKHEEGKDRREGRWRRTGERYSRALRGGRGGDTLLSTPITGATPSPPYGSRSYGGPGERGREILRLLLHEWIFPLFSSSSLALSGMTAMMRSCREMHASSTGGSTSAREAKRREEEWGGNEVPPTHSMEVDPPWHWLIATACVGAAAFLQHHHKTIQLLWRRPPASSSSVRQTHLPSSSLAEGSLLMESFRLRFLSGMSFLWPCAPAGPADSFYTSFPLKEKEMCFAGVTASWLPSEEEQEKGRQGVDEAFWCTWQSFADGGAYHRIYPASSARICEMWCGRLLQHFPVVFVAESALTTLWVLYWLENMAASRPGGAAPLSFFGQEQSIEEWLVACEEKQLSSVPAPPRVWFTSLLGGPQRGGPHDAWRRFFSGVLPPSCSFPISAPDEEVEQHGRIGHEDEPPSVCPEVEPSLEKIRPEKEEEPSSVDEQVCSSFSSVSSASSSLFSVAPFAPCTVTPITMRWHLHDRHGGGDGQAARYPSRRSSCSFTPSASSGYVVDTWRKDGHTPVEVLAGARQAAMRLFLRFVALSLSQENVKLPGFARQPSGYVLLRLLHLLCFLGCENKREMVCAAEVSRPGEEGTILERDTGNREREVERISSSSVDPLLACLTEEIVPSAHVGLGGYLRRLQVLYLSHSGRYGAMLLFSHSYRSLLDAFTTSRTWHVMSTALLWSALPAQPHTRALLRDGTPLEGVEGGKLLLSSSSSYFSFPVSRSHSWGADSTRMYGAPCWGRGSLAWETLSSCFAQFTWDKEGEWDGEGREPFPLVLPSFRRRPSHHLPIFREVLTHLLLLGTAIPDEAPQLLTLSPLYKLATSSCIPSSSYLLPLFQEYLSSSFRVAPLRNPRVVEAAMQSDEEREAEARRRRTALEADGAIDESRGTRRREEEGVEENASAWSVEEHQAAGVESYPSLLEGSPILHEEGEGEDVEEDWVSCVAMEKEEHELDPLPTQDDPSGMSSVVHGEENEEAWGGPTGGLQQEANMESQALAQKNEEQTDVFTVERVPATPIVAVHHVRGDRDEGHDRTPPSERVLGSPAPTVLHAVSGVPLAFRHVFISLLEVLGWWMGAREKEPPRWTSPEAVPVPSSLAGVPSAAPSGTSAMTNGRTEQDGPPVPWTNVDRAYHTLVRYWTAAIQSQLQLPLFSFSALSLEKRETSLRISLEDEEEERGSTRNVHQKKESRTECLKKTAMMKEGVGPEEEDPLLSTPIVSAVLQVVLTTCPDMILITTGTILLAGRRWKHRSLLGVASSSTPARHMPGTLTEASSRTAGSLFSSFPSALLPWYLECALCRFFYHVGIHEKVVHERWWRPMLGEEESRRLLPSCSMGTEGGGTWKGAKEVALLLKAIHQLEANVMSMLFSVPLKEMETHDEEAPLSTGEEEWEGRQGLASAVPRPDERREEGDDAHRVAAPTWKKEVTLAGLSSLEVLLLCASVTLQSLYGRFLCGGPPSSISTSSFSSRASTRSETTPTRKHIPFYVRQFAPSLLYPISRDTSAPTANGIRIGTHQEEGKRNSAPPPMLFPSLQLYARHPSKIRHELRPLHRRARFPKVSSVSPFLSDLGKNGKEETGKKVAPTCARHAGAVSSLFPSTLETFQSLMSWRVATTPGPSSPPFSPTTSIQPKAQTRVTRKCMDMTAI